MTQWPVHTSYYNHQSLYSWNIFNGWLVSWLVGGGCFWAHNFLNHSNKIKEISINNCNFFFKPIISVSGSHCDYSTPGNKKPKYMRNKQTSNCWCQHRNKLPYGKSERCQWQVVLISIFHYFFHSPPPIPLQAWTGREGSRGLRLPDFKTFGTWRW